jgi:Ca2+-binding EF-hand superfamily protein
MKKTIIYSFLVIGLIGVLSFRSASNAPATAYSVQGTMREAVKITQEEFNSLTNTFNNSKLSPTLGGAISKTELTELINSMPNAADFVRLRFCTDATYYKTSLILVGDKHWYEGSGAIVYKRNGGSDEAFCPMKCDEPAAMSTITVSLTNEEFNSLTSAYQAANPMATLGGRIDKSALSEIVTSLGTASSVRFMFCTDPTYNKTSVIFIGGATGQPGGANLMYRNGVDADAFCPTKCD